MKYIVDVFLYVCILHVCYHVIAPYVRSVGCVFEHLYIPVGDSECPWTMSCFYSVIYFPLIINQQVFDACLHFHTYCGISGAILHHLAFHGAMVNQLW